MKAMVISPTKMLERYSGMSNAQFALTHMVLDVPEYRRFYAHRSRQGDLTILDNGMWENDREPLDFSDVLAAAALINADVVILPDIYQDAPATIKATKGALTTYSEQLRRYRTMVVPQGETWEEWLGCYVTLRDFSEVHFIGIPKSLDLSHPLKRLGATTELEAKGLVRYSLSYHLLGVETYLIEVAMQAALHPWLGSVDTAAPVYVGAYCRDNTSRIPKRPKNFFEWTFEEGSAADEDIRRVVTQYIIDADSPSVLKIVVDGGPRGRAFVLMNYGEPGVALLHALEVERSSRGKGLGKELLRKCIEAAGQCGARKLVAHVNPQNTPSYKLHTSHGFLPTGIESHMELQL